MRFLALATDYDGTLAEHGSVSEETIRALEKLRHSGRKLILVTGRELPDLERVFDRLDLFQALVAENGAVLYDSGTHEKRVLADAPNPAFAEALRNRGIPSMSTGDVIIATWRPYESVVFETIRDLGFELQVIFNKDAVMILPAGVNKMSGLAAALEHLGLSEHNVVGIGDAENDHAFLSFCEYSVAVANAIPALKNTVDFVTTGERGQGVVELIEKISADELVFKDSASRRRGVLIGTEADREISIPTYGSSVLVAGASGSGKSTLVTALLESLIEKRFQFCLIDPEGDYETLPGCLTLGDEEHTPSIDQVLQALGKVGTQVVVNLTGVKLPNRPSFFASLLPRLQEMRLRTGRPHWIVIDEAHHMVHAGWAPASAELAGELKNMLMITVHPEHVARSALSEVDIVCAVGESAEDVVKEFAEINGIVEPSGGEVRVEAGEALVWFRNSGEGHHVKAASSSIERKRHKRKYAQGEMEPEKSFYFRGAQGQLNLRAQNLMMFLQLAEGIDDQTWLHHLRKGDYSTWFWERINDKELADEVASIEEDRSMDAMESRTKIKNAIEQRYTAPA
jgi:phosphoglycolate phosphatase (TIGR01487 family)